MSVKKLETNEKVRDHLIYLGFTTTLCGFKYLVKAIEVVANDYTLINGDNSFKLRLQDYFGEDVSKIMSNIRYCIKDWLRAINEDFIEGLEKPWISHYGKPIPTKITEIIAIIATNMRDS